MEPWQIGCAIMGFYGAAGALTAYLIGRDTSTLVEDGIIGGFLWPLVLPLCVFCAAYARGAKSSKK